MVGKVGPVPDDQERIVEVAGRDVKISNPDKIYFPAIDATKSDLVDYYLEVGDALLTRPGAVRPCCSGSPTAPPASPSSRSGCPRALPTGSRRPSSPRRTAPPPTHSSWPTSPTCLGRQSGCLGLHLWPYRADDPDHADELRIDLDPQPGCRLRGGAGGGLPLRDLFDELGMVAFAKTTGNRGIHIYVRLEPRWDSTEVRAGAVAVARELERRLPRPRHRQLVEGGTRQAGLRRLQPERPAQDGLRCMVGPPPHGRPGVDALSWDEVGTVVPDELTLRTVPELLKKRGDAWAAMGERAAIPRASARAIGGTRRPACTTRPGRPSTRSRPTSRRGWPPAGPRGTRAGRDGVDPVDALSASRSSWSGTARTPTRCAPSGRCRRGGADGRGQAGQLAAAGRLKNIAGVGNTTAQVIARGARRRRPRLPRRAGGIAGAHGRRGGQALLGAAPGRLPHPLRLVRRREPDPGDGRGRQRPRPRLPGPHRPQPPAHGRPRARCRPAAQPARGGGRAQRGAGAVPHPHRDRGGHP